MAPPRIEIVGIDKRFAVPVLQQVALTIAPGSIHGLVGENGAGKSTLINILCGLLPADNGTLVLDGQGYAPSSRSAALRSGLALASQELSLIDTLTIAENILLATLPQNYGRIDRLALAASAEALMAQVGLEHLSARTLVSDLSLAEKQLVELAKALSMPTARSRLLILDEPTSALSSPQAERLHRIIKERAALGLSVLYVSHRLDDVLHVCDTVSVLRDGVIQLTAASAELTSNDLIRQMSGKEAQSSADETRREPGAVRLQVERLSSDQFPQPISLHCHRGEILGIAGLAGAGRSELLHTIFGLSRNRQGRVALLHGGQETTIDSPSSAVTNGMALIAEDRKSQGIFSGETVSLNSGIVGLGKLGNVFSRLLPGREQRLSEELIHKLRVKCEGPMQVIDRLSGGNQQKVLLARWLQAEASTWLLDEPTRGVDVGSKLAIHQQLLKLRAGGAALIVVSSELEELMALCDRILVLSKGKCVATFDRGNWSKQGLLEAAFSEYKNSEDIAA